MAKRLPVLMLLWCEMGGFIYLLRLFLEEMLRSVHVGLEFPQTALKK